MKCTLISLIRLIKDFSKNPSKSSKYKSFTKPNSYCMRNEQFPLFTHGILRAQSECSTSRQVAACIQGVASSF